jgi:hypothetical protein
MKEKDFYAQRVFQGSKDLGSLSWCFSFLSSCFFDFPFLIALVGLTYFVLTLIWSFLPFHLSMSPNIWISRAL